jgi:hypothetical protein
MVAIPAPTRDAENFPILTGRQPFDFTFPWTLKTLQGIVRAASDRRSCPSGRSANFMKAESVADEITVHHLQASGDT